MPPSVTITVKEQYGTDLKNNGFVAILPADGLVCFVFENKEVAIRMYLSGSNVSFGNTKISATNSTMFVATTVED